MTSTSQEIGLGTFKGYFARNATGLVRDVSPFSASVYNMATAAPGLFAAISAFFAFSVFPRANILLVIALVIPLALLVGATFGILQAVYPRSGGDYVVVSRLLHPAAGTASTLLNSVGALVGMGFFAYAFVIFGLQPMVAIIGTISRNQGMISFSSRISHHGWTALFALLFLAFSVFLVALPIRLTMRIQNYFAGIAMIGFIVGLFTLWFVPLHTFVAHFNSYAGANAYQKLVATGGTHHYTIHDTLLAFGTVSSFTIYQWWSIYFAGEIKALNRRSIATMIAPALFYFIALLIMVGTIIGKFDYGFLVAANTGAKAYTLTAPPFWTLLASVAGGSTVLAVVLSVTFLFWIPLLGIVQLLPPIRSAFALAFDGVLPQVVAKVDPRSHIPVVSLAFAAIVSAGTTLWAVFAGPSFFSAAVYAAYFVNFTMLFVCAAAVIFPYRFPTLWRASPGAIRILGVPLITLVGALAFLGTIYPTVLYALYRRYGLTSAPRALIYTAISIVAGVVLYEAARRIRLARGEDISLNYREIPPE